MISLYDLLTYSAIGALIGQISILLGVVLLQAFDIHQRVEDHVLWYRHIYLIVRFTPIHVKEVTDWDSVLSALIGTTIVVYAYTFLLLITAVGVGVIFL